MGFFRQWFEGDDAPDSRLEAVSNELRRLKIVWAICCTPLLSFAAAQFILWYWLTPSSVAARIVRQPEQVWKGR